MKKTIYLILFLILIPSIVYGMDNISGSIVEEQLEFFDTSEFQNLIDDVLTRNDYLQSISIKDILKKLINGEEVINWESISSSLGSLFLSEIKTNLSFLSKILVIAIISAILTNLQGTFENSSVSSLANYITYIVIAILVVGSFYQLINVAKDTVNLLVTFMEIILPILLTFLVLAGGPNTKILFHPMIIAVVNIIGELIKNVIFPLIYFSFIICILSNISNRKEFRKLSDLGRQIIIFIISAAFTVFIGIITIYGLSSKIDGISIRTAKFAIDTLVPIVGGFLSDAVETVIGSSTILKNGIGIIGLFILIIITIFPIIKIAALLLIYKIVGAVIEPIVSSNISNFFSDVSKSLLLVLISMVSVAIMFFITITVIVDTGNNLLMLR
ncbi:stage III sporulation protein AE [Tissierella sp. Yu-01]|uniref:stage III sporulation protein AE n=1 Tax=Tissierella sp. Yu-01 TaxID=3035694 RepID=UPI00240D8EE8|nr:stage III sporulation protein AE [Tissierella sp. Yu-01]WFA09692.1 stage III sporulation protein AE [Tissierella sp. Yu-01]